MDGQFVFGAGDLFAKASGNNPTPVHFGALQGVTVNFSGTEVARYGRSVFPKLLMRGTVKITGEAKFAAISGRILSDLVLGDGAPQTGTVRAAEDEPHTITGGGFNATHAADFVSDLGVVRASNRDRYERVLSEPHGRQYACNESSGAYDFGDDQENRAVLASYTWLDTANGCTVPIQNRQQGLAPTFAMVLTEAFEGRELTLVLNACAASKLSLPFEMEDFTIAGLGFSAMADANGVVGSMSFHGPQVYEIDVSAVSNSGATSANGFVQTGFDPTATYLVTRPAGRLYDGYSAWPTNNSALPPTTPSNEKWGNLLVVTGGPGVAVGITDPRSFEFGVDRGFPDGETARAAFVPGTVTGYSEYAFWISDPNPADNRGGASPRVERID